MKEINTKLIGQLCGIDDNFIGFQSNLIKSETEREKERGEIDFSIDLNAIQTQKNITKNPNVFDDVLH